MQNKHKSRNFIKISLEQNINSTGGGRGDYLKERKTGQLESFPE